MIIKTWVDREPEQEVSKPDSNWVVYIIECSDGTYYTGITNNLQKRFAAHKSGKGAKYTRAKKAVAVRYFEKVSDKSSALKREIAIKKLSRPQKESLIKKGSAV